MLCGGALGGMDQNGAMRFGSQLVLMDMSHDEVIAVAGPPSQQIQLMNDYGLIVGSKLIYRFDGYNRRKVIIELRAGRVVRTNQCLGPEIDSCE